MARTSEERIDLADGQAMRALLALPDGAPPEGGWPAIVAIHDIFGFTPDIRRIAARMADSGYATAAPALYDGAGAPVLCVGRTLRDVSRGSGAAFERLDTCRSWLSARGEVDGNRVGVTGFCMGGGFAIFWAAQGGLQVCAPFYGQVPDEESQLSRVCPVVASFGGEDRPFLEHAERLQKHLGSIGVPHDVKIYEGVGHAFMNDHGSGLLTRLGRYSPMHAAYDETAAEDAWTRMLAFFAEHL